MTEPTISSKAAPVRFENVSKVFGRDVVAVDSNDLVYVFSWPECKKLFQVRRDAVPRLG